jgi:aspartate aminotransferase
MTKLSQRAQAIKPSPTMAMAAKAKDLASQGKDVLSFAIGEPDFPTPANIVEAAIRAMRDGKTKYTAASGIPELKSAICDKTAADLGVQYSPAQVCVSNGGKHALMNIWESIVDPGDEVIIVAPCWVSYPDQIGLCGGTAVLIPTSGEDDFQPDPDQIAAAVTDRTVAILINSPSNPSGAVLSEAAIRAICEIAIAGDLLLVSDEIYKHLLYDGRKHFSPVHVPGMLERTLIADGVAKTYAMPGWRIGWTLGPADIIKACGDIQSQETSNPNTIAQWATVEALNGPQESVELMRREFERRRDAIIPMLRAIAGVKCSMPGGAFYAFPDVSAHLGRTLRGRTIATDDDLALYLLEEHLVSLVGGGSFGAPGYIRLSFACSMEDIEAGVARIAEALG